jgi:hypothetical protein
MKLLAGRVLYLNPRGLSEPGILLLSQNYRARMSDIRLSAGGQGGQTWDSCSSQQCTHDLLSILYHVWTIGMGRGHRESKRAQDRSSFSSCKKGSMVYVGSLLANSHGGSGAQFKHSQKRNCTATVPTFMCL